VWNSQRGSADNIYKTFTLNLSSCRANDTWALQVRDAALLNGGYITPGRSTAGGGDLASPGLMNTSDVVWSQTSGRDVRSRDRRSPEAGPRRPGHSAEAWRAATSRFTRLGPAADAFEIEPLDRIRTRSSLLPVDVQGKE
jgi:hypothetical protein